jgi:tungstate transport system substrate-binding protein
LIALPFGTWLAIKRFRFRRTAIAIVNAFIALPSARYKPVGGIMSASLNTTAAMRAYIISERAVWLSFASTRDLALLYASDPALFNHYVYPPINLVRHSHVKAKAARRLETWLVGDCARNPINRHKIENEQLFTFNAVPH